MARKATLIRVYEQKSQPNAHFFRWAVFGPKAKPTLVLGWNVRHQRWVVYPSEEYPNTVGFEHKRLTELDTVRWEQIFP